jgi:hypothetical protein
MTTEYLDYYMNGIYLYNDNFYILGGLLNNELRSLRYITVININFESITITKAENYEIPKKRIFIENNNIVIMHDILYLTGGCLDDDTNIDNYEKYIYSDFWSYNLNTKVWTCISKNIFHENLNLEEKKCKHHDYTEITQNHNNLLLSGKFLNQCFYIYNIYNNSFMKIELNGINAWFLKKEYHIQKTFCRENYVYFIMKNAKHISSVKFNINDKSYEIYKICDNIYDDVIISPNNYNDNIIFLERKINMNFNMFRFNNKFTDLLINKIRINKTHFADKDYDVLCALLKKQLKNQ